MDQAGCQPGLYRHVHRGESREWTWHHLIGRWSETNGSSQYEEELERVLEIRRTSLSSFVVGIRKEISGLQEALLLSEEEKAGFGAFIDDEYTEELLSAHETEAERLRAEVDAMGVHLVRVKEWIQLKADEEELEISAADPNRFKKRGNAMLKEEKMRKRVEKLKPKVGWLLSC